MQRAHRALALAAKPVPEHVPRAGLQRDRAPRELAQPSDLGQPTLGRHQGFVVHGQRATRCSAASFRAGIVALFRRRRSRRADDLVQDLQSPPTMRALLVTLLLVLAIAGAGVFVWLSGDSPAAPSASAAAASPAHEAPAAAVPAAVSAAEAIQREAATENERVPASAAPPKPRKGIEDVGAVPVGIDYTPRYEHVAHGALLERLTRLEDSVDEKSNQLFAERFASGKFTTHAIAANDARAVEEIVESLTEERQLCSTRLVMSGTASDRRPQAIEIVCLPRAEFPELYALVDERDWLSDFIARKATTKK
jgi:hypothetical protein